VDPLQSAQQSESAQQGADAAQQASGGGLDWSSVGSFDGLASTGVELLVKYGFSILGALLILGATWFLSGWARRAVVSALQRARLDETLSSFVGTLVRWGVVILGVLASLSLFGIDTTTVAAVLGGAGIAIGLAIQGNLANFAAGVLLLIVRPFKVGDWVEIGGESGMVDEIGLFTTRIDTLDKRRVFLPNNAVFGGAIENRSYHAHRRVDVMVGVTYDTDLRQATQVLTQAMEAVPGRNPDLPVLARLEGFGASSIDFRVAVWAPPLDYFTIQHEIIATAKEHLDQAGIGIPFPQMDLHLDARVEEALAERHAAR